MLRRPWTDRKLPAEQQTPLNTGITAREEAAKPEPEALLAVEAATEIEAGADLDGVELSGVDLAAEEVGNLAAEGASKGKQVDAKAGCLCQRQR